MVDENAAIRRAAMDLLARREYLLAELQGRLERRFEDTEAIATELRLLAEEGLQSDARYAESLARRRLQRGYGPMHLRQELRQKGLSDLQVEITLASLDVDWQEIAAQVYCKKFGDTEPRDRRERGRRARFMQYRGFGSEHVAALLG